MGEVLFKILPEAEWRAAERAGRFAGSGIDLKDGYIHFSTAAQLRETASLHFKGVAGLTLVAVDAATLGPALRYEPARGGTLFPHLYGTLDPMRVLWAKQLPLGPDGSHVFPPLRADG